MSRNQQEKFVADLETEDNLALLRISLLLKIKRKT